MYLKLRNILLIILFSTMYLNIYSQEYISYSVIELDSTKNNYLITVENQNIKCLIVSSMNNASSGKKIEVGNSYSLKLSKTSIFKNIHYDIDRNILIDDKIIWQKGDDYDVCFTDDLVGLFYQTEQDKEEK